MKKLTIIITQAEEGGYVAKVQEISGCFTQGETINEVLENLKDVIELMS
jgi:predicted RNase H-like HicB family nuclease